MFVQIGDKAFNPDRVTEVYFKFTTDVIATAAITLFFDTRDADGEQANMQFEDEDRDNFLAWWEKADVYRAG